MLGHEKVIWAQRNSTRFMLEDIELAIIEVPNHSVFFEAEIEVESQDQIPLARQKILNLCNSLELKPYSDQEWFTAVEKLDKEANKFLNLKETADISFIKEHIDKHVTKFRQ